jgi:succinate dehydrogenase / fumarate reductase flavoprotein subunit
MMKKDVMQARIPQIVIVGSGVSAMSAAMTAVEAGASVTLVSRCLPARSGSACIREGFNARFDGDVSAHANDTLKAGSGLSNRRAVEGMCAAAPGIVRLFASMGVLLDRTHGEGRVREYRTCGSGSSMTLSSGRATGARVLSALGGQMLRHETHGRVRTLYGWEFLSLVLDDAHRCRGIVAQDVRNMEIRAFPADAVILCTGGYQALFGKRCTSALNDGVAAMRVCEQGAAFANPEFVELFPLTLPASGKNRAVVEAVLTEGGRVRIERDGRSWYFLEEFHREEHGLVPRSQAVVAMFTARAKLGKAGGAFELDLSDVDPAIIEARLSPFLDICNGGIETISGPIEVEPAVGLSLGGLEVNADHATSVEGLFAAGGSVCGYHGAGSLAGNELLASAYGGMLAGTKAAELALVREDRDVASSILEKSVDAEEDLIARISARDGKEQAHAIDAELGHALFESIALGKDNEVLARTAGIVTELGERLERASLLDRSEWANGELLFMRRLEGKLKLARMFVEASIAREESRGCHYKPSVPERDDAKWRVITRAKWKDGDVELDHSTSVAD